MKLTDLHELWRMGIIGDQELIETQITRIMSKSQYAETWTRHGTELVGLRITDSAGLDDGLRVEMEAKGKLATLEAGAFGLKSNRVRCDCVVPTWMMESPDTLKSLLENRLIVLFGHFIPRGESGPGRVQSKYDPITGYV
jgi:hypothetical protein